ncbi:MAG: hypothetical protein A3G07_02785 [Candidatus Doudnabacteria bacterium RIFCSPLOWO2_12_FULL_47_12]|nr:MAG: hypothetical protein A3G07_02785 [Candidatus Doudnabacteria bacterium RIFCSPLOWO2_12_FULL_47_12]
MVGFDNGPDPLVHYYLAMPRYGKKAQKTVKQAVRSVYLRREKKAPKCPARLASESVAGRHRRRTA